jgi:hypothetical protein
MTIAESGPSFLEAGAAFWLVRLPPIEIAVCATRILLEKDVLLRKKDAQIPAARPASGSVHKQCRSRNHESDGAKT